MSAILEQLRDIPFSLNELVFQKHLKTYVQLYPYLYYNFFFCSKKAY